MQADARSAQNCRHLGPIQALHSTFAPASQSELHCCFGPKVVIREQALSMIPFDVMQPDMCQHGQHHVEPVCLCSLHYAHSSFTIPVAMLFATSLSQSSHYILVHCWLQE